MMNTATMQMHPPTVPMTIGMSFAVLITSTTFFTLKAPLGGRGGGDGGRIDPGGGTWRKTAVSGIEKSQKMIVVKTVTHGLHQSTTQAPYDFSAVESIRTEVSNGTSVMTACVGTDASDT